MITQRFENFKLGHYDTVQTFLTCSKCKGETNAVEWHIRVVRLGRYVYTCPMCKTTTLYSEENKYE